MKFLTLVLLFGSFIIMFLMLLSWFCRKARKLKDENDKIYKDELNKKNENTN